MRSKIVFPCGCVKVRNLMNRNFRAVNPACRQCRVMSAAMVFHNLADKKVTCKTCHGDPYGDAPGCK